MGKLNLAIAVIVVIGAVIVTTDVARGATADCVGDPALNVAAYNAEYGFRPYLLGIGTSWWQGKSRIAAVPTSQPCGTSAVKAQADQQRFYVLLRAFPAKPTKAQWKARFKPLVQAAIVADQDFLTLGSGPYRTPIVADLVWLASVSKTPFGRPVE